MKTTVDLPEELLFQAKSVALTRKTTLRELVISGLRRELLAPPSAADSPLQLLKKLDPTPWKGLNADAYIESLREGGPYRRA